MMCSFQRMHGVLMNRLERKEGVSMHIEGSRNPSSNHMRRELEMVKFLEFWGSTDGHAI